MVPRGTPTERWRRGLTVLAATTALVSLALVLGALADEPIPSDDWTFRPTVMIRNGKSQGSGIVIASRDGASFVLTAEHVIRGGDVLRVELHRYNLGLENRPATATQWPRAVPARVVATDPSADVAVLRLNSRGTLPYVARLSLDGDPPPGTLVTSVGIDKGATLSGWHTKVQGLARIRKDADGQERLYLITMHPPEHGRSGGGLFLEDGTLIGVCVGRIEREEGPTLGLFASNHSIRRLLRHHKLDQLVTGPPSPPAPQDRPRPSPDPSEQPPVASR